MILYSINNYFLCNQNTKYKMATSGNESFVSWEADEVLAEELDLPHWVAKNVVELLDADNTVPFIARYRKEKTNNMEADKIREVKAKYEELK